MLLNETFFSISANLSEKVKINIMFHNFNLTYVHRRLRLPHLVYKVEKVAFFEKLLTDQECFAVLASAKKRRKLQFADRMRRFTDNITFLNNCYMRDIRATYNYTNSCCLIHKLI